MCREWVVDAVVHGGEQREQPAPGGVGVLQLLFGALRARCSSSAQNLPATYTWAYGSLSLGGRRRFAVKSRNTTRSITDTAPR